MGCSSMVFPFALSLSKGFMGFDKLSPNGYKLSPNGNMLSPNGVTHG